MINDRIDNKESEDMTFGKYVKKCRQSKGFSQRQLAMYAEISNATISRLEKDSATPDTETVSKLIKALDLNASYVAELIDFGEIADKNPKDTEFDLGTLKLNKIARYAKDLTESDQDTVLNVLEALRRAKAADDKNDDTDEI